MRQSRPRLQLPKISKAGALTAPKAPSLYVLVHSGNRTGVRSCVQKPPSPQRWRFLSLEEAVPALGKHPRLTWHHLTLSRGRRDTRIHSIRLHSTRTVKALRHQTHRALCRNRNRRLRGREHARSRRSPFRPPPHTNSSRDLPHQGKSRPPRRYDVTMPHADVRLWHLADMAGPLT